MAGAKVLRLLAFLTAVAVLATGCGGKSGGGNSTETAAATTEATTTASASPPLGKSDYVAQMQRIGQSLSSALNHFGSATTAATAATALARVQTQLRTAADKLAALNAPAAISAQHAKLVQAVRDFAAELGPVITKLRKGDLTALQTVPTLKGLTEIQSASTAIASKGYAIGGSPTTTTG
jgi:hypothetical protein